MAEEPRHTGADPRLITKIISSYVSHHNLGPDQIPELIRLVHRTMGRLGKPAEPPAALTPAVPIRRSVQREAVTCLDCGWRGKMLRRHLTTRHGLSGDEYLRRCDEEAEAVRHKLESAGMTGRVSKEEMLARGRAKGSTP